MVDANNSIIYTTDCHIQFNCIHFCVHMIFLLMLKICMAKNVLLCLFQIFQKISNFSDFPLSSTKFPDFPWLHWLSGKPSLCCKFQRSKTKTHGNSMSFSWTSLALEASLFNWLLEFPHALSLISLENLCPQPSLSPCLGFSGIAHSPSPSASNQSWALLI